MDDMSLELTMSFMKSSCRSPHRFRMTRQLISPVISVVQNLPCWAFPGRLAADAYAWSTPDKCNWHHKNIFMCTHHITIIITLFAFITFFCAIKCTAIWCKSSLNYCQKACGIYNPTSFLQTTVLLVFVHSLIWTTFGLSEFFARKPINTWSKCVKKPIVWPSRAWLSCFKRCFNS